MAKSNIRSARAASIDQVLPQWHADLYGLGDLYDPAQVKQASAAIYKHNFIPEMGKVYNPCRIYCLERRRRSGHLRLARRSPKPLIPAPYSQETMNGFEYCRRHPHDHAGAGGRGDGLH